MPRIKRWAPIAHGFNRDPEVRDLRRKYGDWMGYVWLEMCSIGDLNGGEVKGTPEQIGESLAYISLLNRPSLAAKRIANALQFMANCGWIAIQLDHVLILNHAKYHPFEISKESPPNDRTTERPNNKNAKPASLAPSADSSGEEKKPKTLNPAIKPAVDRVYQVDPKKFERLVVWVKAAERTYTPAVIIRTLDRFLPFARDVSEWWPYLDKILDKEEAKQNASESEKEHERIKREEREWLNRSVR